MSDKTTEAPADFAAREADLATKEQALAAREAETKAREARLQADEAKRRRDEIVAFAAGLADQGRILPRQQPRLVEVLSALPEAPVSFAGEDGTTVQAEPSKLLREFLAELPPQIQYGEKSRDRGAPAPVAFAAPAGASVDTVRLEVHRKAVAYQAAHPNTDYLSAVAAVGG